MINSLKLGNLRNSELLQFLTDVLAIVFGIGPSTLQVQEQYNLLYNVTARIESLFKIPAGSLITAQLEELDLLRDNAFSGIKAIINGHTFSTDLELKNYAEALLNHLKAFGSELIHDNYQSETATLRNIINDWTTMPELAAAISALGLDMWKQEMEDANSRFQQLYVARAIQLGNVSQDSIGAIRAEGNEAYYALRDNLNAYHTIKKGEAPFDGAIKSINGLVEQYNGLLNRRGGDNKPEAPVTP